MGPCLGVTPLEGRIRTEPQTCQRRFATAEEMVRWPLLVSSPCPAGGLLETSSSTASFWPPRASENYLQAFYLHPIPWSFHIVFRHAPSNALN